MRVIGRSVPRLEDGPLLKGEGRFIDDIRLPGMLHAAFVRSPHAHALIRKIDASAARKVASVFTARDFEQAGVRLRLPLGFPSATLPDNITPFVLTPSEVCFVGEAVAMVVADSRYLAEDAAAAVEVDYQPLDVVVDTRRALERDAPLVHPDAGTNVATDRTFSFGDVDAAFAGATHVVTGEYTFPRYSSVPMECYGVVASWSEGADGPAVEAWANFHGPFTMVPVAAGALGIPTSRFRLHVPADIGGSFGIKSGIYPYVVLMALASRHAGRPVRWTEDRIEHLLASSSGAGRVMAFEAAVDDDGRVGALRVDLVDDVGAYLRPPEPSTLYRCFGNITGAYDVPAVAVRARAAVTNRAPTGLNRGFGGQQLYFGLERLMDAVAARTGLDVVEVRRRNLVRSFPHRTPTGGLYDSGDYDAALDLVTSKGGYDELRARQVRTREEGAYYGVGLALVVDPSGTNIGYVGLATPASERRPGRDKSGSTEIVRASVDVQGVVTVMLGSVPQGQGHATVARRVAAARLGLPLGQVRAVVDMDTASTPWTVTSGSYSSRFAPLVTSAVVAAVDRLAETIRAAATVLLGLDGVAAGRLELVDGSIRDPETGRDCRFRHAAGVVHWDPGSLPAGAPARLATEGEFVPPEAVAATADDRINSSLCYGFVAEMVGVRIDPDTLEVTLDRVATVHDAGTVLDPVLVEGQVLGALVHGLGGAAYEEFRYSEAGQPTSATFLDYLCPTSAETAFDLVSDHVCSPSPLTALGAKGCGEGSSMSFPAAFANAVADALAPAGVTIDALPLHGETLFQLLRERSLGR
jgi:2-furoyl-CoA dehydrogenase large subunit